MSVIYDGEIHVHYRFVHLAVAGQDLAAQAIKGQRNGLCGATTPGQLSFVTGLHTGHVRFAIEWSDSKPAIDDVWEEVVEVPVVISQHELVLSAFEDSRVVQVPTTGPHRARFNAVGMDEGNAQDTAAPGEPGPDRYLLQLWPAPAAPDEIVRQTSVIAGIWHRHAQESP